MISKPGRRAPEDHEISARASFHVSSTSSTATQSLLRQRHILTEAGLLVRTEGVAEGFHPAEGVLLFEDPATTSKTPRWRARVRSHRRRRARRRHPHGVGTVPALP
ncbi:hypothetical protein [Microtetraspora fusca]|uniref:hypothetical protein n=1 Tax=Microtetraspora fusca TaxID=1997 RepID=UPI001471D8CF|nr:hypothetical protein [Microtetraspora fusca]